jgi:hypothetical protein
VHYPRAKQLSKYPGETAEKWAWNTVVFAEVRYEEGNFSQ